MAFNGSGVFLRLYNWVNDAAAGIKIRADRMDSEMNGFATGLSNCITKDGQTTVTANLPMATYKHTNVGVGTVRTDYTRLDQAQDGNLNWADGGGTADAITATYSPTISTLVDGQECYVRATAANTSTTPTFSPNALTARTIVKNGNQPLVAGDISGDGHELHLRYRLSDTKWELLNPSITGKFSGVVTAVGSVAIAGTSSSSALISLAEDTDNGTNKVSLQAPASLPSDIVVTLPSSAGTLLLASEVPVIRNFIDGYQMSTAGASTTMTIGAGQAANSTNAAYITLASSINKTTGSWAVGTGNGGLDTGTIANNTKYYFYAIRRPDTGVVDVVFSTNATSPTLPTSYTQFRRIGAGITNGSGQWVLFQQNGDVFLLKDPDVQLSFAVGTTRTLCTAYAPANTIALLSINFGAGSAATTVIQPTYETDVAPSSGGRGQLYSYPSLFNGGDFEVQLDASAQFAMRSTTSVSGPITTRGWVDKRGKE